MVLSSNKLKWKGTSLIVNRVTQYPEINKILDLLLSSATAVLGNQLVGMYLYGSLASGDFNLETSDIDFLVQFDSSVKRNRFDNFFALRRELMTLFGRDVDLVEPGGLRNPYFIEQVNQTRKKIYAVS